MRRNPSIDLTIVLKSAAVLFFAPLPLVLGVLLIIGIAEFFAAGDFGEALRKTEAFRLSPANVWLSYAAYGAAATTVGVRLGARLGAAAIPHIWLAVALAVVVHVSLHGASGVAFIAAFADYKLLQHPVLLIVTAFAGFHAGCWHNRGTLLGNDSDRLW